MIPPVFTIKSPDVQEFEEEQSDLAKRKEDLLESIKREFNSNVKKD